MLVAKRRSQAATTDAMAGRHHRASEALGRGRRPGVLQLRSDRRRGEQLSCSTYVPGHAYQPPVPYVRATHNSLLRTVRAPGGWPLYVRRTRTRCSPPEHLVASGSVGLEPARPVRPGSRGDQTCTYGTQVSRCVPEVEGFAPDVFVAIGGGGFIPARMLRTEVKRVACRNPNPNPNPNLR